MDPFGSSSSGYQQPFYQLQSDVGRSNNISSSQHSQNDFESGWYKKDVDSGRNNQRSNSNNQNMQGGLSGFG